MTEYTLIPVADLQAIKGIQFPAGVKFKQLLISGPPGAGKSTLVKRLGGWPEEGYVNLASDKWWTAQCLAIRPREIHLGIPFVGIPRGCTVYDEAWLQQHPHPAIDFQRICIPPEKRHFFSVNWHERYVFEFLLPSVGNLMRWRRERARYGTHPIDETLDDETVRSQLQAYWHIAHHLYRQGLKVYIRQVIEGVPQQFG